MSKVLAILFPWQSTVEQLGLRSRWWHRLAVVAFFASVVPVLGASWLLAFSSLQPEHTYMPDIQYWQMDTDGNQEQITLGPPITQAQYDAAVKRNKEDAKQFPKPLPVGSQMVIAPPEVALNYSAPLTAKVDMPDGSAGAFVGKSDAEITYAWNKALHKAVRRAWLLSIGIAIAAILAFSYLFQSLYRALLYVVYGANKDRGLTRKATPTERTHLQLGHHLVVFLDVLGQRERFRELHLPKTPEQTAVVAEVLRQTAGFVLALRKTFDQQFTAFESGLINLKKHTSEPVRPKFVGISDSFVTSVPLRNESSDLVAIVTVFSALSAAAVVMLTSLASRHPLRGGIDVGLATEIGPGEIYGTGLESAYLLESNEARYPRIVIGDGLWNYLNVAKLNFQMQSTPEAKSIVAIIKRMVVLISIDCDGKKILDYLGPVLSELPGSENNFKETMVKPLYEFVLSEQERINGENDTKLIERYKDFRHYVESRLHLWGLEAVRA